MSDVQVQESAAASRNRVTSRGVVMSLASVAVAGLLGGLLWSLLATPPVFTIGDDWGAIITERGLSQVFAMDIWYLLIGVVLGLALGASIWALWHRFGWPVVVLAVAGAVAAGLLAWAFGHLLGPRDFVDRLAEAKRAERVPMDLSLHSWALVVVWPVAASVSVLLASLWAAARTLRR